MKPRLVPRNEAEPRRGFYFFAHFQYPTHNISNFKEDFMAFITQAVTVLQTLVVALGAGLAVWGVVNLMEGYGNDNPGANAHVR